eukprot:scaffold17018_cov60-Phaeocystis_antarctica.AAC.5
MLLLTILSGIKRTVVSRVRTGLVGVSVCVRDVGGNSYSNKKNTLGANSAVAYGTNVKKRY